jgi:hypothetical protein
MVFAMAVVNRGGLRPEENRLTDGTQFVNQELTTFEQMFQTLT